MGKSSIKVVTKMKSAALLWAEEEARVVIAKEKAAVEAKAAAKAKAEDEIWNAEAIERARAKALAAAESRAAEEARVAAAASDEWFYLLNGEQIGPVSLTGLKEKIVDLSIEPPLKMVWTAGMDGWKPVYEVRKLCEPLPSNGDEIHLNPTPAEEAVEPETNDDAQVRAAAEAAVIEAAWLAAAAQLEAKARAQDAEEARIAAAQNARAKAAAVAEAKAAEETKLRAAEEAKAAEAKLRAAAEAKAALEAKLREAAEAKAVADAKIAAAAKLKAEAETKARRETRAKAAENAKVRILARARAAERNRPAEALPKAGEDGIDQAEPESTPKRKFGRVSSKNCWFYTCQGERLGPVNFEELRAMAADSSLDPRLDMVWRQSMDAWKPAGQIDGLFERSNVSVESTAAASSSSPPRQSSRKPTPKHSTWPGARRRSLILVTLVLPFAWHYALAAASPFLVKQFGPALMGQILPYAAFAPLVVLLHFGLKRLVNLGMSRWWCLVVFAPVLNLWLGFRCFACPPGYAYHQKLDGRGIALAMVYWLVMLAAVLALAACVAVLGGAIDSPVLLKQLRGLIRIL